ncbi:MAG: hypothetical protein JXK07_13765 [Spirochaetes bacterium]|nr:hypothetical protein [Spirochaetota bacterium]MBN2769980.1 hypothetical protein [Spirochaetota bacterium]
MNREANVYWILSNELVDEDKDADLTGVFVTDPDDDLRFDDGKLIKVQPGKCTYTLTEKLSGNLTDNLSIDEIPGFVWSSRLCDLMISLNVCNLQFFDLTIIDPDKRKSYIDYKIVNIVRAIDCIDFEKSEMTCYDDGDVEFIDKLVLSEDKIQANMEIFRLARNLETTVFSDRLKMAIDKNDITGCVLYRVDKYSI